jgi:CheY-like chemotaxis protein
VEFEFGDLFTQCARQVLPQAHAKGLLFLFDHTGPMVTMQAQEQEMRRALHRLFCAAIDVLREGFVFFAAQVSADPPTLQCRIRIAAACSGLMEAPEKLKDVLTRLQLNGNDAMTDQLLLEPALAFEGPCPASGGKVRFMRDPREGTLFSLEIELRCHRLPDTEQLDAAGARAWLISDNPARCRSMERRLEGLGWATSTLRSIEDAARRLERLAPANARPALVVGYESGTLTLERMRWLWALLPPLTHVVLAAELGSPALGQRSGELDIEIRPYPFSPSELRQFTRRVRAEHAPSGETTPAPLSLDQRRRALVVDDNAVNQMVASGMLQVLGFEVDTANDGEEAISVCLRQPPDLVLMDLHMPGMDGLESTRRLRMMQQQGSLRRFPIVAATADVTATQECREAGMDGLLPKPLSLEALDVELRRVLPQAA